MSQWTHLAGIIRVDNVRFWLDPAHTSERAAGEIFRTLMARIPVGSNGTQTSVQCHPTADDRVVAIIEADLEDTGSKEDVQAITEWFKDRLRKLRDRGYAIRQAVLEIEVEDQGYYIVRAGEDT